MLNERIGPETARFAVLGQSLPHTWSPYIHNSLFDVAGINAVYLPVTVPPERLGSVTDVFRSCFSGFNVTIPYKEKILPFLDDVDEAARVCGAVNTVEIRNGRMIGHITDGLGMLRAIEEKGVETHQADVLILGGGGAARVAGYAFLSRGGRVTFAVRDTQKGDALAHALELYGHWAAWKPEQSGVLVAYASFHGHTAEAAKLLAEKLHAQGETVEVIDLNRVHKSYAVSAAFKYDRMALCATTYDGAYAPAMEAFLSSLKLKGMQGRKVALVENGTWAPMAAKHMRAALDTMKNMQTLEQQVTIRSAMNAKNREELAELAQALAL